jgi:hypothetical protein
MMLAGQLAVGPFDLIGSGTTFDAESLIRILHKKK